MIEKMTRYDFVLLKGEENDFLLKLQELGLVDVNRSSRPVDQESAAMLARAEELKKALKYLEELPEHEAVPFDAEDPVAETFALAGRMSEIDAEISVTEKEIRDVAVWGDFDSGRIGELESLGLRLRFYDVERKGFDRAFPDNVAVQVVHEDSKRIRFVTVSDDPEYSLPYPEIRRPSSDAGKLKIRLEGLRSERGTVLGKLSALKARISGIRKEYAGCVEGLDRYLAREKSGDGVEGHVVLVEGFAPSVNEEELCRSFDEMGVLYLREDAREEDNPPIKLRNNRFSKLFESITGMYGMPDYGEFDPTPILSVFFMLFFAMCMGDAGYGIVLFLFGIALNRKWVDFEMFRGLGTLISILGAATFFVGMVLGTAFGVNLYEAAWVPDTLKSFMISDSIKIMGYSAQMVLAIGIGIFHICLAMIVKTALNTYRKGFRASLGTWGWTLLIVGGVLTAGAGMLMNLDAETVRWAVIGIALVSCLGIFVFNTPGRNPLINIGAGLWDAYQMATGLLGDLLSYIRLYALGLAGGLLGASFNKLGQMVLGDNPTWQWVPFALIIVAGHVLNVLMSSLGAFVHPLRLSFVEYFKNSGYNGEGRCYNPLVKKSED